MSPCVIATDNPSEFELSEPRCKQFCLFLSLSIEWCTGWLYHSDSVEGGFPMANNKNRHRLVMIAEGNRYFESYVRSRTIENIFNRTSGGLA